MRVGIYNRWLTTLGGGERHMFDLALALAHMGHRVEILSPVLVDSQAVRVRLNLEIAALGQRVVDAGSGPGALIAASSEYDLFVLASHGDLLPQQAGQGWMLVFFPEQQLSPRAGALPAAYLSQGAYAEELDGAGQPFRWLAPQGALWIPSGTREVRLTFERSLPGVVWLTIAAAAPVALKLKPGRTGQAAVRLSPADYPAEGCLLRWQTERLPVDDPRALGVRLLSVELRAPGWERRTYLPDISPDPRLALESYQRLIANSAYTAGWIGRRWGRSSTILPPAVAQYQPGEKRPIILSVGRFFQGLHAKRQDALIEAFRALQPSLPGWELHLLGGLDETNQEHGAFLARLRESASGLPVVFHVNAGSETLAALYAQATLYWHAAGYGSDPELSPESQEHFGISTVEAMSAGCVPLVYGQGGSAEVVRDGLEGRLWSSPDQLAGLTLELLADPVALEALARQARLRAEEYSPAAFRRRVAALLAPEPATG